MRRTGTNFRTAKTAREKLYWIITPNVEDSGIEKFYDFTMIGIIILSILPLCFRYEGPTLKFIDYATVIIFILDYLARWLTADFMYEDEPRIDAYMKYPFGVNAIIDVLAIVPTLGFLNRSFELLRVFKLVRVLRVVRIFKAFRYSKSIELIARVVSNQKENLLTVFGLTIAYIFSTALIMFQVEPITFRRFFDALYWATISLTTIGYGDVYPVTHMGKFITILSALMGIVVVALPAGIMTAGFMEELQRRHELEAERKSRRKSKRKKDIEE